MKRILIPLAGLCLLTACNPSSKKQAGDSDIQTELSEVFPENPSREGYEGFQWQTITGAGLRLWAQCNENLRIVTDASIPGARIERMENGHKQTSDPVIQILDIPGKDIHSLIPFLQSHPRILMDKNWTDSLTYDFREVKSNRAGVTRYILEPTGKSAKELADRGQHEPVPFTCYGWGVGNSGARYFEVFHTHPQKAVFVEVGQDMPLFDEQSIQLFDSIQVLHGQLIMGHEAYSFTPDADTTAYWVVDKSGELKKRYEAALPSDAKPYTAIPAKLKIRIQGPSSEGFAAEYAGVMEVMEIEEVGE